MGDKLQSLIVFAILATALLAFAVKADQVQNGLPINGCAIPTPDGLVQDRDCDGVDDIHDNCKFTPNTDQADANRNDIGDACDLLVTRILLDPGTDVNQGEFYTVRVQLINNKAYEIDDVQARIRNVALKLDVSTFIPAMKPAEQRNIEFILKTPGCASPGRYELTFTTDHKEGQQVFTQALYQRINVVAKNGTCNPSATVLDNTILDTVTNQDVEIGDHVIYPITVTNLNAEAMTYHLSLRDAGALGSYRLDPQSTFTVEQGGSVGLTLYIQTERFAPLGRNTLRLVLESDGKTQETPLTLRVIQPVGTSWQRVLVTAIQLALILIVLALVIGAGVIAYRKVNADDGAQEPGEKPHKKQKEPKKGVEDVKDDGEFQSYY